MAYDAFVFDNDGVLTRPTDRTVLTDAIHRAFEDVGVAEPTTEDVETLLGPTVDSLWTVASAYDLEPATLWEARERAAIEAQREELASGRKRPYDDVDVIETLEAPTAIVSNNQHETIGNVLEHCSLASFDTWYGREPTLAGIERKKPEPYYLERAIEELGVENPIYVGDSRVDVAAADAVGIDTAFVRRDHRQGYELPTAPTYEIESLAELSDLPR
ncbi:HAD family hydrolase [Natronococcus occultus]|uniref:Haloacid dehalogenase superfamily enzyme, subfamily IA n=1 Tax=Natronococcus occultus SP4 TaxID=694430 RepID=L0JWI6_9EURY|nr:HAD family hydrolase [Natronococcus occultus]AGB37136.1 haloacid dehalogenase superfamily enzyme, subfamily IA [Natronococcus occultus SP4]